ncbi:MAG TPA: DUF979 family protein, partial [Pyrinomonadaceae bacterium]|nr:DUF979 family protein [Pyrinomonadaceae bacterium]
MPSLTAFTNVVFSLDAVYIMTGVVLWVFAALNLRDRRTGNALFWLVLGIIFALGSFMPHWLTGLLVLSMVVLDGAGRVGHKAGSGATTTHEGKTKQGETTAHEGTAQGRAETTQTGQAVAKERPPLGNKIFLPVLLIPV